MNLVWNLVVALQIIAALVMIGLVLIQHGKGADMGASFGSGASGSLFGATGSANFMSRSTAACAAIFFACTLALAYFSSDRSRPASGGSVLDQPSVSAPAASGPLTGAAQVPGANPASSASPASPASSAVAVAPSAPAATASGAGAVPAK
jgi:preprotein translocase subunit SecG